MRTRTWWQVELEAWRNAHAEMANTLKVIAKGEYCEGEESSMAVASLQKAKEILGRWAQEEEVNG